jgi:hypothetical protein
MADEVLVINQEGVNGADVKVSLVKERELRIVRKGKRAKSQYSIDVLALDEISQRKMYLGWKWFLAGVVIIVLAFLAPQFVVILKNSMLYQALVYVAGAGLGAACFYMAWKVTNKKQIFNSRKAKVPLVELVVNKPSKKEFSAFVKRVESCINAAHQKLNIAADKQLTGEMKTLRRLADQGVLSRSEYETAKSFLLSNF